MQEKINEISQTFQLPLNHHVVPATSTSTEQAFGVARLAANERIRLENNILEFYREGSRMRYTLKHNPT